MRCLSILFALLMAGAAAAGERAVVWNLPQGWEDGVSYGVAEGYAEICGGTLERRYDFGRVGEPDLPFLTVNVGIPAGASFVRAEVTQVTWTPVDLAGRLPVPIAEAVPFGARLVYPAPDEAAYAGDYPSVHVSAGLPALGGGITSVSVRITPYRWVGREKRLYKATSMSVAAILAVPTSASKRTILGASSSAAVQAGSAKARALKGIVNPEDFTAAAATPRGTLKSASAAPALTAGDASAGEIIILSPSEFVGLWKAYSTFRQSTEAGRNFTYTVVNTADIYTNAAYWTESCDKTARVHREDSGDALALHHYLEKKYDANREQYVILGAAPTKYRYDRATMIPARYVVNQNHLDEVCDMYYGCMDRPSNGNETWDSDADGFYMGHRNADGSFTSDDNANIDWEMDVPVTRVPLMREVAETSGDQVWTLTAAQIMDNFTNRIAFAENEERWDYEKRWRNMFGGSCLFRTYPRESQNEQVRVEYAFFDGGLSPYDERHRASVSDGEAWLRRSDFDICTYYRSSREVVLYTDGYKSTDYGTVYKSYGDIFVVQSHGWARGADIGSVGGVRFATGTWRVFNMALPCDSGMYDYGVGYGVTNCISMGEAPLLCFGNNFSDKRNVGGGLVTFNNTRPGWGSGYGSLSSKMERLVNRAFCEKDLNAGQACRWIHNNGDKNARSRAGACNLQVVMHGDPLIKISSQYDRTWSGASYVWTTNAADGATWTIDGKDNLQPMAFSKTVWADTSSRAGEQAFDIREDFGVARLKLAGSEGQSIVLGGAGRLRVTDSTVVTNADLVWNAAGGAGRMGVTFAGRRGNLTMEGNATRYFGYKIVNADRVNVAGGNVTFAFDHGATAASAFDVARFSFIGTNAISAADGENYNVIRTRAQGFFPSATTIPVVSNCVELQTWNIGGGTSDYQDKPLFYLTNAWLKVSYNPYRQTEYFVRPTYLTGGHIMGAYNQFGFGRPDMDHYDLYVWGQSSIAGTTPIKVTGELRIHLMDSEAELVISNTLTDGHGGASGRLRILGAGKVRIAAEQTFTGGITVEDSASLELAGTDLLSGVVAVKEQGSLILASVPVDTLSQIVMEDSTKLILSGASSGGTYQVVDPTETKLVMSGNAAFYDASDLATPLVGVYNDGVFVSSAKLINWNLGTGIWTNDANVTASWIDRNRASVGFTNGMAVALGPVDGCSSVTVSVNGEVRPDSVYLSNAGTPYVFEGSGKILTDSLSSSHRTTCSVPLVLDSMLRVLDDEMDLTDVTATRIEVATHAKLRVDAKVTQQKMTVRGFRFVITEAVNNDLAPSIRNLCFFRNGTRIALPSGTEVRDSSGGKWTLTEEGEFPTTWQPASGSVPAWFTITFPQDVELVTGYSMRRAEDWRRTPRAWSIYATADGETYELRREVELESVTQSMDWLGSGNGSSASFDLQDVEGQLIVHAGGTLVAKGTLGLNLVLEPGAVLEATGEEILQSADDKARVVLPDENGSVLVDASGATKTSTPIAILKGFDLSARDFFKFRCATEGAVLNLSGGNLYLVTDGAREQPYSAALSGEWLGWSSLAWQDADGRDFTWDGVVSYDPSGCATLESGDQVTGARSVIFDVDGTIGTLRVAGSSTDAVSLMWYGYASFLPLNIDFSDCAGDTDVFDVYAYYGEETILKDVNYIAGCKTTIPYASSGTLSIGAGKRAIIGSWLDYGNISGEGTLTMGLTEGDVDPRWSVESRVTGTNELAYGIWTIANQDDYPRDREILISSTNATLKLTTVNDTTGYEVYSNGLTVADGGQVVVDKRDTFNRLLTLRNGGRLLFTKDASDNSRIFDFYEDAAVRVTGEAPSVIGGTADGVVGSGIVALRRTLGLNVDVDAGATLKVYAQWGCGAGAWNPWYKTGEGTVAFYRSSGQSGSLVISNGVVRLVDAGQGTTGEITNGGTLELNASENYEQYVPNAINGTGTVVKTGAGCAVLAGNSACSGTIRVEAGTLAVASAQALGTATVVMEAGTLELRTSGVTNTVESPSGAGFRIRVALSPEEQGLTLPLVRLGAFADGLDDAAVGALFDFVVNGQTLAADEYRVTRGSDGTITYSPNQAFNYAYPLVATVTDSRGWDDYAWQDQKGVAFTNLWAECPLATAVVTVPADVVATMTATNARAIPKLTVAGPGAVTLARTDAGFTVSILAVTNGASVRVAEDGMVASHAQAVGSAVHWPLAVTVGTLKNTTPGVIVGYDSATFDAALANDQWVHRLEDGDVASYVVNGFYLAADVRAGATLNLGTGSEWIYGGKSGSTGAVTNSVITVNGGTVTCHVTGAAESTGSRGFILGNSTKDVAVKPVIAVRSGFFDCSKGQLALWENATVEVAGGRLKAKGLVKGSNNNASNVRISGGLVEIGSVGIKKFSGKTQPFNLTLAGGTIRAYETATIASTIPLAVGGSAALAAADGATLSVAGTTTVSAGTLSVATNVTLAKVVFSGTGKLALARPRADLSAAAGLALFGYDGAASTLADRVAVRDEDGEEVEGVLTVENAQARFYTTGAGGAVDATRVYWATKTFWGSPENENSCTFTNNVGWTVTPGSGQTVVFPPALGSLTPWLGNASKGFAFEVDGCTVSVEDEGVSQSVFEGSTVTVTNGACLLFQSRWNPVHVRDTTFVIASGSKIGLSSAYQAPSEINIGGAVELRGAAADMAFGSVSFKLETAASTLKVPSALAVAAASGVDGLVVQSATADGTTTYLLGPSEHEVAPTNLAEKVTGVEPGRIRIVHRVANGGQIASYDITAAFSMTGNAVEGVSLALDEGAYVQIGDEAIAVVPELATKEGDEHVATQPFAITDGSASVGVKTIPGLVYTLVRGASPAEARADTASKITSSRAEGTRTKLQDTLPPSSRAFYIIRVGTEDE